MALGTARAAGHPHLRKAYGPLVAVDDVSFEVAAGEIFGILGPNGAGRTAVVECPQGLRRPDSGQLSVLGFDPVSQHREVRRRIGSQLQSLALPDRIKVWEALDLFGVAASDGPSPDVLLREWGLADKRSARFGTCPGASANANACSSLWRSSTARRSCSSTR